MTPEVFRTFWTQILGDADVPQSPYDVIKADAWGVGAILYYAATGQHLLPDPPASAASTAAALLSSSRCSVPPAANVPALTRLRAKSAIHPMVTCQLAAQMRLLTCTSRHGSGCGNGTLHGR